MASSVLRAPVETLCKEQTSKHVLYPDINKGIHDLNKLRSPASQIKEWPKP